MKMDLFDSPPRHEQKSTARGEGRSLPFSEDGEKGVLCSLLLSPRDVLDLLSFAVKSRSSALGDQFCGLFAEQSPRFAVKSRANGVPFLSLGTGTSLYPTRRTEPKGQIFLVYGSYGGLEPAPAHALFRKALC